MNTLKFGNGEWYGKKDTILAYNDLNSNFKPLPFSFDRDTIATRINKDGLIETVGSGEPRIDYKDDSKGALLLEPSRSNLITYSEAFDNSYWTKSEASVTSGFTSPDGATNSFKLVENSNNSAHIIFASPSITLGNNIFSVFAKASERRVLGIEFPTNGILVSFDLIDGVFVNSQANPDGFSITPYANGWYRIDIQEDLTSTSVVSLSLRDDNGNRVYQGDGTSGLYIYGAQLEQGSYATSYIPRQGSIGTRVAESCEQTVPDGVIGQTEGTIYLDTVINTDLDGLTRISLSEGASVSNWIFFSAPEVSAGNVRTRIYINNGGNLELNLYGGFLTSGRHKIALAYKENDVVLYVDGVLDLSNNSASIPSTDRISLTGSSPSNINADRFNKHSDFKLYNTRLSNAELQALTTI